MSPIYTNVFPCRRSSTLTFVREPFLESNETSYGTITWRLSQSNTPHHRVSPWSKPLALFISCQIVCTLVCASVTYSDPDTPKGLLSFFEAVYLHKDAVDLKWRIWLAVLHALASNSDPLTFHWNQHYPFHRDSTISKYRLFRIALHTIDKYIPYKSINLSSKQWQTDVFETILPEIMSDFLTASSLSHWQD